jgi:hypothetical protein
LVVSVKVKHIIVILLINGFDLDHNLLDRDRI